MTTMNAQREQLDDLLDARAEIRMLRTELTKRRAAVAEIKGKLASLTTRFEDVLTEIEVKQGRLPFKEPAENASTPADMRSEEAAPANGEHLTATNGRRRRGGQQEARA
jgi:hypothetical protein